MCGFAGFLFGNLGDGPRQGLECLRRMADSVAHRGPDSGGEWLDERWPVGLGSRRLAVLDCSPEGDQPMESPSGRFVLAFNGEIYNHLDLRAELEAQGRARPWRGRSDTETLAAGFEAWGIEATIRRTVGMFAFAAWDKERATLTLGRDRMGEKPLYWGWQGQTFLFGSELKALEAHPAFQRRVDRGALAQFFRFGYVPGNQAIFRDVWKLPAGHLLEVSPDRPEPRIRPYWSLEETVLAGLADPFPGDGTEAVDELERLLVESVAQQVLADVPVGVFLSGGVDSSTVAALAGIMGPRPVRTFTAGFEEPSWDESRYARQVAEHLGTDHAEIRVTPSEVLGALPDMPRIYDEPYSDPSMLPTFLLARFSRLRATVCLTGDGGDELFGGYDRYLHSQRMWGRLRRIPRPLRALAGEILGRVPPRLWDRVLPAFGRLLPAVANVPSPGERILKGAGVLRCRDLDGLYWDVVTHWKGSGLPVRGAPPAAERMEVPRGLEGVARMLYLDMATYLPDNLMVKVDRASMAVALECRAPMLDHRVVAFAWRLPLGMKVGAGGSKWVLRQVLHRHLPAVLAERPKAGFGPPVGAWLRGPLREWAEDLLGEDRLRRDGFLEPAAVRDKWRAHLEGRGAWQEHLWDALMFQAWVEVHHPSG